MKKTFYIENYGCQMNINDSEILTSILLKNGFLLSDKLETSDIILFNACSIRENAEKSLINKLNSIQYLKNKKIIKFIIIGCFSKQFEKKLKKQVDIFISSNNYKKLPELLIANKINISISRISRKESYDDIIPFRKNKKNITAFVSITRGCNNMCTFCIVPFTRGREISRNPESIINECKKLYNEGYKEIILLGQNVDSYKWQNLHFDFLLKNIAKEFQDIRIRFSTSNPHDMSNNILNVISKYENICKHIHLPVQSGSNKILKLMKRKYSREKYLFLVKNIKKIIPNCSISHDIMTGFCYEEEQDHLDTISLMKEIKYHYGYMFMYSHRPGTYAFRKMIDDVPYIVKKKRLEEIIELQKKHSLLRKKEFLGLSQKVLIEGLSKKNNGCWRGKNTQNITVIFPKKQFTTIGDIVYVKIKKITSATLIGSII